MQENWEKFYLEIDGVENELELLCSEHDQFLIRMHDQVYTAKLIPTSDREIWQLSINGKRHKLFINPQSKHIFIQSEGWNFECKIQDEKSKKLLDFVKQSSKMEEVHYVAPMPGLLMKFLKQEGEKINLGEPLAILSAMKMENELRSNVTGTIKKIHIPEQTSVEKGALLVTLMSE
ncbi:MAG: acetyl-CoA carboxylase biotin carboxyl carrier protein subunit [bacterium]|nr:acetyl-CoA carboxylase biotin carboxyl carrier protein subunit [bacterium]